MAYMERFYGFRPKGVFFQASGILMDRDFCKRSTLKGRENNHNFGLKKKRKG